MWTPAARAELAREPMPYASSLTNAELAPLRRSCLNPPGSAVAGAGRYGRSWRPSNPVRPAHRLRLAASPDGLPTLVGRLVGPSKRPSFLRTPRHGGCEDGALNRDGLRVAGAVVRQCLRAVDLIAWVIQIPRSSI